ncbi:MAG: DUF6249 domain-containing protein [Candidatus Neomarinimicrobiota bacterium]
MLNESPFMIVAVVWLFVFGIIAILVFFHYKRRQLQSEEIMAAIEKGIEVPFPPQKKPNRITHGIFWTIMGLALLVVLAVSTRAWEAAIWGLIPIAVGFAVLLSEFFDRKMKD